MSSYYLVLIIGSYALWGTPIPYPDASQCEAAGLNWRAATGYRYHCLPAPIVTGDSINRRPKGDAYPAAEPK